MRRLRSWVRGLLGRPGTRRLLAGASLAAASVLGGVAQAAEGAAAGGHHEPHLNLWSWDAAAPPTGWFIVDFAIFVGLLVWIVRPKLAAAFQERHRSIKAAIEHAQQAFARAKAHAAEYRDKLQRVEAEIGSLIEGAKKDGASERDRIVALAKDTAGKMRTDTKAVVDQELENARRRLRSELVAEVLQQAQQSLDRQLSDADRERLLEQAIAELENGAHDFQAPLIEGGAQGVAP